MKERIRFLEQCLDNKEKVNISLRKDIKWYEKEEDRLRKENRKLKEERDFFKEQAMLWRNDYKNEYEGNRKLKEELEKERLFKE
jgi:cell division protein FtsB